MPRPSQGPQACAVPRKDGACMGHVQTVPAAGNAYEIDFSIDDGLVKQGYASEAVRRRVLQALPGRRCDKSQSRAGSKTKAGPRKPLKAQNGQKRRISADGIPPRGTPPPVRRASLQAARRVGAPAPTAEPARAPACGRRAGCAEPEAPPSGTGQAKAVL